jgi:PAS domain S-box-containing protein
MEAEFPSLKEGELLSRVVADGSWKGMVRITNRHGRRLSVEVSASAVLDGAGACAGFVTVGRDVTERMEMQQALRESEEKYRSFLAHTTEGVYRLEMTEPMPTSLTTEEQVDFLYDHAVVAECNEAFARMYGVQSGNELLGMTLLAFHGDRHDPVNREEMRRFVESGYRIESDDTHERDLDGREHWFSNTTVGIVEQGMLVRIWGTQTDVSERRLAQQERENLLSAIHQAAEIVVVTDVTGQITYVNPAFEKVTGYGAEEAIGNTPALLKSGEQDDAFYRGLWETITSGNVWRGRFVNRRKDGSLYTEEATISPVCDSHGNQVSFVAVKHDVTRQLALEESLQQTQKMEAIGTLAGGIAHDFNNILAAIMGYTELLTSWIRSDDARVTHSLEEILAATRRARELTSQILAFSRKQKTERRHMSLSPLVKETAKLMRGVLPSTVAIHVRAGRGPDTVLADPGQMHQVLMNLCTNAWQAMRDHGGALEVTVSTTEDDAIAPLMCPDLEPGPYVRLTVADCGVGIPAEDLDRILEPFFTTKSGDGGTGLGLAVVHGIVRGHGGGMTIRSRVGQGTTVEVLLPLVREEVAAPAPAESGELPGGYERILVVDDEAQVLEIVATLLLGLGYHVSARRGGALARDALSTSAESFDLVVTDLTMPHVTGLDLLQTVQRCRPDLPVILCTGYDDQLTPEDARERGFSAMLHKPIPTQELARVVRQVLDSRAETGD